MTARALREMLLVNVADFFYVVVMPRPCADDAPALMRFKLAGWLTLPDIRDNIIAVADKDAHTVVA